MAKEFKKWIDEFVENGANPADVTKWPSEAGGESTIAWKPTVDANGNISWIRTSSTVKPVTQNIMGPRGIQGPQGIQGPKGEPGENAASAINPRGDFTAGADPTYTKNDYVAYTDGNTYVCKKDNPTNTAPTTGFADDEFWQILAIRGAHGPQGEQGIQGPEGPMGPIGPQGPEGIDGTTYTPKIGTVTTIDSTESASASVSVNNETKEAVFNFAIPKGAAGKDSVQISDNEIVNDKTWSSSKITSEITSSLVGMFGNNYEFNDITVHSINHRGANDYAPENTMSAFRISKELGFTIVECDVDFTADNVPVVIHDSTVDRTSNGTGEVHSFTFEAIRQLDFGSWKSSIFAGEKIPSFEEFILGCRKLGLHPYIEIKTRDYIDNELVKKLVDIVKVYGMERKVTWISFGLDKLQYVVNNDKQARVGFIDETFSGDFISRIKTIDTGFNEAFFDINLSLVTDEKVNICKENGYKIEVWTVDSADQIINANSYISGFTSNTLKADWVILDSYANDGDDMELVTLTDKVTKTEYVKSVEGVFAYRRNGWVLFSCLCTLADTLPEEYAQQLILFENVPRKYIPQFSVTCAGMGWGVNSDGSETSRVCRISVGEETYTTPGCVRISESNMKGGDRIRAQFIYPIMYHRRNN